MRLSISAILMIILFPCFLISSFVAGDYREATENWSVEEGTVVEAWEDSVYNEDYDTYDTEFGAVIEILQEEEEIQASCMTDYLMEEGEIVDVSYNRETGEMEEGVREDFEMLEKATLIKNILLAMVIAIPGFRIFQWYRQKLREI